MHETLVNFFKALEQAFPPPPNCHHALTYAQYGSDDAGWSDMLAFQINIGGKFHSFFLGDEDFAHVDVTIHAIAESLAESGQLGVPLGQYKPTEEQIRKAWSRCANTGKDNMRKPFRVSNTVTNAIAGNYGTEFEADAEVTRRTHVCNCADWGMTFHLSTCPAYNQ